MKVATFNVNGIKTRLPHLLQWLQREQPDVACLQELKALDEGFPAAEIRAAGYQPLWRGQRSWNGVAILARGTEPIERRRSGLANGLVIEDAGSAAIDAGVMPGDVLLAVNGKVVNSVEQVRDVVGKSKKSVALLIQRGNDKIFIPVRIG